MSARAATADLPLGRGRLRLPSLALVAFAAAAIGAGLGRAVATTYLPLLLNEIDDEPGLIGTVMLVNAAAGFAVPLVVGAWSDRLSGRARRTAFLLGGSVVTALGLVAVALGSSSSYLALAAAGALVYTGLNAVTTIHRALVPERFEPRERPKATSAQELALLVGGLLGLAVGGALTELALWAPFAAAAVVVPLLALPTVLQTSRVDAEEPAAPKRTERPSYRRAAARPHVRAFLVAQILWVLGYAALPAFFVLYAEEELGLRAAAASVWLALFGVVTAAAIVAAGRVKEPARQRPLLVAGVALMGAGFLGVAASTSIGLVAPALLLGAVGFGLISTLGFPLFSTLIPAGEEGGYSALYFSVRAIASTVALPLAGVLVAATGSYRSLFVLGGGATLAALIPLGASIRPRGRLAVALGLLAIVPPLGLLIAHTPVGDADEAVFGAINGLGPGHDLLWTALDPHTRNYLILIVAALAAAALTRTHTVSRVATRVVGSALVSWALLEAVYAVYDRPRPEEVVEDISLNGHSWAHLNSFPSGHMAITAALAAATAFAFPRARHLLWGYVAAVAFTRVMFGAHFPLDTIAGTAVGTASALLVALAVERIPSRRRGDGGSGPGELAPTAVAAVMPSYDDVPDRDRLEAVVASVGALVVVDDGSSPAVARALDEHAAAVGAHLVRMPQRSGKGSAVRAGADAARALGYGAILVIDADGQHPAEAIPAFVAAAAASELVIGDRFGDLDGMPLQRRLANRTTRRAFALATGHAVRDTQNGMRLIRGRALELLGAGGYEAETIHLRRVLRAGLRVGWVPIPAIYADERSSFRPVQDSAKVLWALLRPLGQPGPRPARSPFRAGFRPARRSGSALPGTPATAPRRRRALRAGA